MGPITSLAYVLTLEDPQRFSSSREVGPYLGLVPKQEDSGDSQPQLGISKTGDRMLRRLLYLEQSVTFDSMHGRAGFLTSPLHVLPTKQRTGAQKSKRNVQREDNIMKKQRGWIVACAALLCVMSVGLAYGGDKVKMKGLITTRTGETLTVKTNTGNVTVVLDDDTKVQQPKGIGLRKKDMSAAVLIPGLKVSVEGTGDADSKVTAKTITFDSGDLQLAETIQAGLNPTQQQQATNMANISANKQGIAANQEDTAANKVQIASNQEKISANQEQISTNQQDIAETTKRFSELSEYDTKEPLSNHQF